jgi:hypothetical protein
VSRCRRLSDAVFGRRAKREWRADLTVLPIGVITAVKLDHVIILIDGEHVRHIQPRMSACNGKPATPISDGSGVCQPERLRMFHDTELGCREPQTVDRKWILPGGDRGPRGRHAATECIRVDQRNKCEKGREQRRSTPTRRTQRGIDDIHAAGAGYHGWRACVASARSSSSRALLSSRVRSAR